MNNTWKWVPSVLLFIVMLSCSRNSDTIMIFQGDPGLHNLPTNVEFGKITDGAQLFNFSTLKYENHIREILSGKAKITYTSLVRLKDKNNQLAVTKTEYYFLQPNGLATKQVTDIDVGIPGVVSLVHLSTKQQTLPEVQFRKVVRRVIDVNGGLFPLKNGNQLSLTIVFSYQASQGSKHNTAQELSWSYTFRIVEDYEGYMLSNRTIPGKVYVIDKKETDPEGNIDNTLIHFSESLGAVIRAVRQGDGYTEETRLVAMEE